MGAIRQHEPVLLFLAAFSRYEEAIDWGLKRAKETWGPTTLESERFEFAETRFYEKSMGTGLRKVLVAFAELVDPASLPKTKLLTNAWEDEFAATFDGLEQRPLNLDPGHVTEAKLVLASTKDRDHRIYLDEGVFAENTLFYQGHAWQNRPWTYPNYQRPDYHHFLNRCREYYRRTKRTSMGAGE